MFVGVDPRPAVTPPLSPAPVQGNTNWVSIDSRGRANTSTVKNGALHMCLLSPSANTFYMMGSAPRTGQIASANVWTDTGTCTVNVWIAGALVTNLSALSVSSTPTSNNATGANTISVGNSIAANITSVSGSPNQLNLTITIIPT